MLLLPLRARTPAVPGHLQAPIGAVPCRDEEEAAAEIGQEGPAAAAAPPMLVWVRRERDTYAPSGDFRRLVVGDEVDAERGIGKGGNGAREGDVGEVLR